MIMLVVVTADMCVRESVVQCDRAEVHRLKWWLAFCTYILMTATEVLLIQFRSDLVLSV